MGAPFIVWAGERVQGRGTVPHLSYILKLQKNLFKISQYFTHCPPAVPTGLMLESSALLLSLELSTTVTSC